jgi:hypothetical protein
MYCSPGTIQATIKQKLLPPMQCFNKQVNFDSLYGTCMLKFFDAIYSDTALITYLNVNNDLFISIISLAYLPSAPV